VDSCWPFLLVLGLGVRLVEHLFVRLSLQRKSTHTDSLQIVSLGELIMSYMRSEEAPSSEDLFPGVERLLECQLTAVNFAAQKAEHLSKYVDNPNGNAEYTADRLLLMAGHLKEGVILTYVDDRGYYGEALFNGKMDDPFLLCKCTTDTLSLEPGISLVDTMHLHAALVTHINRIPVEILDQVNPQRLLPVTREENCERMGSEMRKHRLYTKLTQVTEVIRGKPITQAAFRAVVERLIGEGVITKENVPSEVFTYETKEQLVARGVNLDEDTEGVDIRVLEL